PAGNRATAPCRDLAHRVRERQPLLLHQEAEHVARLAAAEAFVEALRWNDVKRRCLLVVERTQRTEVLARPLERDQLPDHLDDVGAVAYRSEEHTSELQ